MVRQSRLQSGEHTQAEQLLRQSLPVLREIGRLTGLGLALNYLSRIVLALGRLAEAKALLEESLALGREVGNRWAVAVSLIWLGEVLNLLGEAERLEAEPLLQESAASLGKGSGIRVTRSCPEPSGQRADHQRPGCWPAGPN